MSKRKESSPSEGGRDSDDEEEGYQRVIHQSTHCVTSQEYHFGEPGPSHRMYPSQPEQIHPLSDLPDLQGVSQASSLRTRGPGRPRIHPPKPAGVSRPRGRPKGSKNKKPRKRIERPPKRPRGRPRKWPPEMWEGFQRTREAAVQQQLKHHHHQQMHHSPADIPGPSHMYMDPSQEHIMRMQQIPPGLHHSHQMQHLHHHQHQQQQHQSHMTQYMQMSLETDQPQDLPLVMPRQTIPQELVHPPQHPQQMMPSLVMPGSEEGAQETLGDPEELLWMQHLPPEDLPPHTTS